MRKIYQTRDAAPAPVRPDAAEDQKVVEEVRQEIGKLGDNVKDQVEAIRKEWEDFKNLDQSSRGEGLAEEQLNRIATSIAERTQGLEKKMVEQRAEFEKALSREFVSEVSSVDIDAPHVREDVVTFNRALVQAGQRNFNYDGEPALYQVDVTPAQVESLRNYTRAFGKFLARGENSLSPEEMREMSVGSDPDGGILVPPTMSRSVAMKTFEGDPMRQICDLETIATDAWEERVDAEEADCGYVGEKQSRPKTGTPQMFMNRIPLHEIYAAPTATQKQLDFSITDPEAWLNMKVAQRILRVSASKHIVGTGVNMPSGILNGYELVEGEPDWKQQQLEVLAAGATTGLTYAGWTEIKGAFKEEFQNNLTWLMKRGAWAQVMRIEGAGDQGYLFAPPTMVDGRLFMSIAGDPIRFSDSFEVPDTNKLSYAVGDFRVGYKIVDGPGIRVQRDPYTRKPLVEFYSTFWSGGGVQNWDAIKVIKCVASL